MEEYYIHEEGALRGPYSLVDMIRKIRAKNLNAESLISYGRHASAQPLLEHPLLRDIWEESQQPATPTMVHSAAPLPGLSTLLSDGWDFLDKNQILMGMLVPTLLVFTALGYALSSTFSAALTAGIMVALVHLVLPLYYMIALRLHRGQAVEWDDIVPQLMHSLPSFTLLALCAGGGVWALMNLPLELWISLLSADSATTSAANILPQTTTSEGAGGAYNSLMYNALAALLLHSVFCAGTALVTWLHVERSHRFAAALGQSLGFAFGRGLAQTGRCLALWLIAHVAAALLLLPLLLALPIVLGAEADMYERSTGH